MCLCTQLAKLVLYMQTVILYAVDQAAKGKALCYVSTEIKSYTKASLCYVNVYIWPLILTCPLAQSSTILCLHGRPHHWANLGSSHSHSPQNRHCIFCAFDWIQQLNSVCVGLASSAPQLHSATEFCMLCNSFHMLHICKLNFGKHSFVYSYPFPLHQIMSSLCSLKSLYCNTFQSVSWQRLLQFIILKVYVPGSLLLYQRLL